MGGWGRGGCCKKIPEMPPGHKTMFIQTLMTSNIHLTCGARPTQKFSFGDNVTYSDIMFSISEYDQQ